MNLPATVSALLVAFALAACGGVDTTETESDELSEKDTSTQTPPSHAPERARARPARLSS